MKLGRTSGYIKGEKKFFTAITLLITAIFLTGFISRVYLDKKAANWEKAQLSVSREIANDFGVEIKEREEELIDAASKIKFFLRDYTSGGIADPEKIRRLISENEFGKYNFAFIDPAFKTRLTHREFIFRRGECDSLIKAGNIASSFFHDSPIASYLVYIDTLLAPSGIYYVTVSDLVNRKVSADKAPAYSLLGEKSEKNASLKLTIHYDSRAKLSLDGRDYSEEIKNVSGKKIGVISFTKPGLRNYIEAESQPVSFLQSVMVILVAILIPFAVRRDIYRIKSHTIRLLLIIVYLILLRILTYILDFTSYIFPDSLTDPLNFASGFGFGIVKSPLDLTITVIFFLIISVLVARNSLKSKWTSKMGKFTYTAFTVFLIAIMFLMIRAYAASVKSIIFDSSLRFFKSPEIIPALPSAIMNLAALLLSIAFFLLFLSILSAIFSRFHKGNKKRSLAILLLFLIVMILLGTLFILYQRQPLISVPYIIAIIIFSFILLFLHAFEKKPIIHIVLTSAVFSAISGVAMLNLFNSELERQSLKTSALEVNRRNENLIYFILNESLLDLSASESVKRVFAGKTGEADAAAFSAWSTSSLRKEGLSSSVTILSVKKKRLGGFVLNLPEEYIFPDVFRTIDTTGLLVIRMNSKDGVSHFSGMTGIFDRGELQGFIVASVEFDADLVTNPAFPELIRPGNVKLNSVVDPENLSIVIYTKDKIKKLQGDFSPGADLRKRALSLDYSKYNEAWLTLEFNNENYLFYFLKTQRGGTDRVISVGLKERELSWSLFNFFKLFILQIFYILIFYSGYLIYRGMAIKESRHSYRSQLFVAFIVIALLPLIALAVYNRMNEQEKSRRMLENTLREKSTLIENHVSQQLKSNSKKTAEAAFAIAARELNATFTLYSDGSLKYTSLENLASAGVLTWLLSPSVENQLMIVGANEVFTEEYILGVRSHSLYRRINVAGSDFIISINELLNPVAIVVTILEVDVFIIGIYSFAVVIIILLSGILSNRISQPIAKLTKATKSIAHGDLNVSLDIRQKGEIGELIEGFKFMTSEIRRNQKELAEQEREIAWREIAKQVAHEIKNPLTPMKLSIQQLVASHRDKAPNFDEIFEKISATVLNQIDILNQIASEFSRFAKMPSAKLEPLDISAVLKDVIALYTDEKVKFVFKNSNKPALVMGDISQLRRMFINFVRNSIQAGAKRIEFELNIVENNFELGIKDDGAGIPEEARMKIFNKNFTTKPGGMGLGLKLSKRFIESIGGRLELISGDQGNTEFKVSLPQIES